MTRNVIAAAAGDPEAFADLVDRHRRSVCAITLAILGDATLSEDAAQEAFFTAWRELPRLRSPERFTSWMHQIARNQARMHARSARRAQLRVVVSDTLVAHRESEAPPPFDLEAAEEHQVLHTVLGELPEECREVLVLYYWEDQSTAEVARQLMLSDVAVRKRLSRAREALRQGVEQQLAEQLRQICPTTAFTVALMVMIAAWPRPARAAPSKSVWAVGAVAAVCGALLALSSPLFASREPGVAEVRSEPVQARAPKTRAPRAVPRQEVLPAQDPEEEALLALAEAGRLGVVRCDLQPLLARGVQVNEVTFSSPPFVRSGLIGHQLLAVLDEEATDEGRASRTFRVGGDEAVLLQIEGTSCAVSTVPPPPERTVSEPPMTDPALDKIVAAEIAGFEELGRQALEEAQRGQDPYQRALQRQDLSPEARALLEQWRAAWMSVLDFPLLSDEARALLEEP
jgi:RNA polymerase sigma factor (sigma-70 family)